MSLPNFPEFDCDISSSTAVHWTNYTKWFENMLLALNITHPARQLVLLLHCGGEKLHDIYDTFTIDSGALV